MIAQTVNLVCSNCGKSGYNNVNKHEVWCGGCGATIAYIGDKPMPKIKICRVTEEPCSHPERSACTYCKRKSGQPRLCSVWVQGYRVKILREEERVTKK